MTTPWILSTAAGGASPLSHDGSTARLCATCLLPRKVTSTVNPRAAHCHVVNGRATIATIDAAAATTSVNSTATTIGPCFIQP